MVWHEGDHCTTRCQLLATVGNFFVISHCCFIFVVKEKSPEALAELNLGLSDTLESSIFSRTHII